MLVELEHMERRGLLTVTTGVVWEFMDHEEIIEGRTRGDRFP